MSLPHTPQLRVSLPRMLLLSTTTLLVCLGLVQAVPMSDLFGSQQQQQQLVLNTHRGGILRRFKLGTLQAKEEEGMAKVLAWAQDYDLDVWQQTHDHVDIYFPDSAAAPAVPDFLAGLPQSTSFIPAPQPPASPVSSTPAELKNQYLPSLSNSTFHTAYHGLLEVESFLHGLIHLRPDLVHLRNIGRTAEGREIQAITISKKEYGARGEKAAAGKQGKPGFVIMGAQHAREWVATAASLHLAHALVSLGQDEPHSLGHLLKHFDFHIIPMPNPDGYHYTWNVDRYWYKNRQVLGPNSKCRGLDMNRNWGHKWEPTAPSIPNANANATQIPADPCSFWYPGHRPFEAPEVNNVANFVTTLPNLVGFVDLRSYGQMISSPFSFSCDRLPRDAEDQFEAAVGAARAAKEVHGAVFTTGTLCQSLYRAPGNILDWMYAEAGIKYAYAVHLRDTGTYGFSLPGQWIKPVGEETGAIVRYLAEFVADQMDLEF